MSVAVGCPIRDRMWILPRWFEHVANAVKRVGENHVCVVFVGDCREEPELCEYVDARVAELSWTHRFVQVDDVPLDSPQERVWNYQRYGQMVELRNTLLRAVRELEPDFFWSLDSDILTHEDALALAIDAIETRGFDAVGTRCYMTSSGTWCPSYAMLTGGGLNRPDAEGTFLVDCIMASKVMTPKAYFVDYVVHEQGEDIGWSIAAREQGVTLGWDGRTISKHVMHRHLLDPIDERVGF